MWKPLESETRNRASSAKAAGIKAVHRTLRKKRSQRNALAVSKPLYMCFIDVTFFPLDFMLWDSNYYRRLANVQGTVFEVDWLSVSV